jgi:hypothetical protein
VLNSIGAEANAQAAASGGAVIGGGLSIVADVAGAQDIVASGGSIVLPELPPIGTLRVDDLFSGGSYTQYNLALGAGTSVANSHGTGHSASTIDILLGDQHSDSGSHEHHHGASAIVPSALEELHLRGIDGLI